MFLLLQTGDHYLGRLLVGLDPHSTTFSELPPHFEVGMENQDIHDFVYLLYGPIIRQYEEKLNITSCLLLFSASLAYHANILKISYLKTPHIFFQDFLCLQTIICWLE